MEFQFNPTNDHTFKPNKCQPDNILPDWKYYYVLSKLQLFISNKLIYFVLTSNFGNRNGVMYIDTCRLGDLKQQFSFQNLTITNLATGLCITTMVRCDEYALPSRRAFIFGHNRLTHECLHYDDIRNAFDWYIIYADVHVYRTQNDTMGIGSVPVGLAFCTNSSSQQFYFGSTNRICASFLDGECLTVDARFKNAYFWSPPDLS